MFSNPFEQLITVTQVLWDGCRTYESQIAAASLLVRTSCGADDVRDILSRISVLYSLYKHSEWNVLKVSDFEYERTGRKEEWRRKKRMQEGRI